MKLRKMCGIQTVHGGLDIDEVRREAGEDIETLMAESLKVNSLPGALHRTAWGGRLPARD